MPFSSGAEPTFSSCKEVSSIGVEKRGGEAPTAAWIKENSLGATAPVAETPPRKQQDSESKAIPADKEKEQPSKVCVFGISRHYEGTLYTHMDALSLFPEG